jgi:SAM-dependent methyltransferase
MADDAVHWDNVYRKQGRLWGGSSRDLPELTRGSLVREIGCGNGRTFATLLDHGVEVIGIDFSLHAAGLIAPLALQKGEGHIVIADARHLPFVAGSFDAVIAMHVIGHLAACDRERIGWELARVLSGEGLLWFTGFSQEDFRAGKGCTVEPGTYERKTGIRTHYFTEGEVRELFSGMFEGTVDTRRWTIRVRGTVFPRAEIVGIFRKSPGPLAFPEG